jgi:multiple sugar transport system substrate-binding protein
MWAVPSGTSHASQAAAFIAFLLRPDEVRVMTDANGAVPGTRTAAAASARFGADGPLALLRLQLEGGWAVARPRTPAYPFISSVFQDVFESVRDGVDLAPVLTDAARVIDREIDDNHAYPGS